MNRPVSYVILTGVLLGLALGLCGLAFAASPGVIFW